jgi:dihydrofolate reductase
MASKHTPSVPEITLVAAMSRGRVIGRQGGMPWHLPADLKHFKDVTLGYPVIMGRRTFDSIGRALPGRKNVVISRSAPQLPPGVVLASSLENALRACSDAAEVMVIGGGEIYHQALPLASRLELTFIDADIEGDTQFPAIDGRQWRVSRMESRPADERNAYALRFVRMLRG